MEENLENKRSQPLIAISFFFIWGLLVKFADFHIMHSAVAFVLIYAGIIGRDNVVRVAYIGVSMYVLISELIRVINL